MTPEGAKIPDWALRERENDLRWISENYQIFWPVATSAFDEIGRGAIVVDTTVKIGEGNPFGYFPQDLIDQGDDDDIKRMVRKYDPQRELIIVLLKSDDRVSTYRVSNKQSDRSNKSIKNNGKI